MKNILNNAVSLIVVMIVLLLIIPLSPFFLDVMIILNIAVSLIILLVSMNIKEALEFSIFPSLLLITTLYRIGINISSTRSILSNSGTAGQVIKSMGDFVLQGNVVVGVIIFLIIVLVQFLVITKGAERVAEVAARFTLDAMPGKQMAIDADLGSGLITEEEAKARRYKIQKEADFYGSMDGATKIVKGDATMSLIITAVNFLGGCVIGMVQGDMGFTEVLQVYSIATIGDGLVSQIPALLISTATGMIVTRAVAEDSLNIDVTSQFGAQPKAIMIAGGVLAILLAVPGMPKLQLAVIALIMMLGGFYLLRRMEQFAVVPEQG
ncbi:MAG: flagellar biosynthesis protein FlhA, partial [Lachnospiraceae bacterium]|nr:flagellar biosynthesis protein FlhA [Lachnospiraceae bacterium]